MENIISTCKTETNILMKDQLSSQNTLIAAEYKKIEDHI